VWVLGVRAPGPSFARLAHASGFRAEVAGVADALVDRPVVGFAVRGLGFGVWGVGFGVWGLWFGFGVWGLGFRGFNFFFQGFGLVV
jgi:hypothetical protein